MLAGDYARVADELPPETAEIQPHPHGVELGVLMQMFRDTTARNLRSYLVQSYARDMGNGNTVMMREIDVPIRVQGRHWGGFRTAYKL